MTNRIEEARAALEKWQAAAQTPSESQVYYAQDVLRDHGPLLLACLDVARIAHPGWCNEKKDYMCQHCHASFATIKRIQHAPDCAYARLQAMLETNNDT